VADELKHENGDVYPSHFVNKDTLSADILRHLCPYVFKKDQVGRRNSFLEDLIAYHEKITKKDLNQSLSSVGVLAKKTLFHKESPFFVKIEGYGNYRYVGDSVGDGFSKPVITLETDAIAGQITPDKELSARNEGRESLYVWWHKDSEELAKLKNHDCWAMKIGKHNSPNVSARFESYRVAIPHKIRLGLIISCKNCSQLEKAVHTVLENRGQKIGEEGSEWFNTNVNEILDVLRFQHLIE
jgi:hypothetical protein